MGDPPDITQDRGFKAFIHDHPYDALEFFAPEVLRARGRPATLQIVGSESLSEHLTAASRFHDVAVLASWSDEHPDLILLVEHWSRARAVHMRRVLWYVADLALRHPQAMVLPVMLITERLSQVVDPCLQLIVGDLTTLTLRVQVVAITPADRERLLATANPMAAVLLTLAIEDAVDAVATVLARLFALGVTALDIRRFYRFIEVLARLSESDRPRLRHRLEQDGLMEICTEWEALAKAEGIAEGKAEAHQETVHTMLTFLITKVQLGAMTPLAARDQIRLLHDMGTLTADEAQQALTRFP